MGKVTVKNTTSINVKIQEGNAGVFVTRALLKPGRKYTLELDPNATYREYVLIRLPDNTTLDPMFSSDDVVRLREIVIKQVKGSDPPKYTWDGIVHGQKSEPEETLNQAVSEATSTDAAEAGTPNTPPAGTVVTTPPAGTDGWFLRAKNYLFKSK